MVDPSTVLAAYGFYTLAEDIVRHGRGFLRMGRVAITRLIAPFLDQHTSIDYERVENDEEYFEQLVNNLPEVQFDDGINLLESIIDSTISDLRELHDDYCKVCDLAMKMDAGGEAGHIMGGVYEEESLWDHIRYEIGRTIFWDASDEYGEYYDENYDDLCEADWKEDPDDWIPCYDWDAVDYE